ncbi:MAG: DUF2325 domain-containing protein [Burkholderiales bacterium]|nr:DUF2325 domain-containing protein [Burkholderiales bacterium]
MKKPLMSAPEGEIDLLPGRQPLPAGCRTPSGSRRRRLWELAGHALCPVIGVCLPMPEVRRLANRVMGGRIRASDYELHCGVNTECRQRNAMAEAVQRELDQRYAATLREHRRIKSTELLAAWWAEHARQGPELPGALWATLTHPRCNAALEEKVLQDVHLLQHQSGAAERADLARLQALHHENQVLGRQLAAAQTRATRMAEDHARLADTWQSQAMRLRAELIGRDTVVASLWDKLRQLEAEAPDLPARSALRAELHRQTERCQDLERALSRARQDTERERQRADEAHGELQRLREGPAAANTAPAACDLSAISQALSTRSVLCVGGRQATVPVYRHVVEQLGARFLHHDGGEEEQVARLDHTLAAADLVICQTGCISHDAYWRVKDHCKRTGKRCVFVENPSRHALERALEQAVKDAQ